MRNFATWHLFIPNFKRNHTYSTNYEPINDKSELLFITLKNIESYMGTLKKVLKKLTKNDRKNPDPKMLNQIKKIGMKFLIFLGISTPSIPES